jgi:nucleoside-diphosphate-sugar epimerase
MDILITGSNGFLGKEVYSFLKDEHVISELSNLYPGYSIRLDQEIPLFRGGFDVVLHIAGKAHIGSPKKNEMQEFYNVNVIGTQNLLAGLEKAGVPKQFVFISSVAVYGKDCGKNYDESTPLNAKDAYGKSKITAELIILNWCRKHNVICTILRLPLVVGINPPGNLGALINAIRGMYYFNISGGKARKSMVLAADIAKCILKVAEFGGIYNLTDGYHPSFNELSYCIAYQLGKKKPLNMPYWMARSIAYFGDLFGMEDSFNSRKLKKIISDLTFDDTKARKTFGWNPAPVLECFRIVNSVL